ncbi:hypothetical protein OHA53_19640 [Streptomyces althioticus]|uniref:hypothetical protein n=1 Tax=Streptomyces althioticus TaxID=83380 RepID=UPI0038732B6C|nr:hypothetical protein OHA53_19640 [Streptomyces althioticus]
MTEPAARLPVVPPDVLDAALGRITVAEPDGLEPMDSILKALFAEIGDRHYIPLHRLRAALRRYGCKRTYFNREPYYYGLALITDSGDSQ